MTFHELNVFRGKFDSSIIIKLFKAFFSNGGVQQCVEIHRFPAAVAEAEDELPVQVDVDVPALVDLLALDPLVGDGREPDVALLAPLGHDVLEALGNVVGRGGGP